MKEVRVNGVCLRKKKEGENLGKIANQVLKAANEWKDAGNWCGSKLFFFA